MSRSFFNWTYVQRLIDKQLTNGWAIGIQANLVWYLTIISNSGRNKRLLRSLPCTSHSCNPRVRLQLNNITAPFGTTKALLLLHTPLGVLILQKITELDILLWAEYVWTKVTLAGTPSRGESPIVAGTRLGDTSLCSAFAKCRCPACEGYF